MICYDRLIIWLDDEHCLMMKTTWWERFDENDLMMKTIWWWRRFDDKNDLMMKTIWWWKWLDDENDLMMKTIWWWEWFDDENDLIMKTIWWWKRFDDENDLMMKIFYLILFNLRFRTISRIEFERRTSAKIRFDSSNKNFCSILRLNRIELFDMFEIQFCGQSSSNLTR